MNSCTSSSDPHRSFALWLLALVLAPLCALFISGIYLEPLDGDLTRLGYFSEREYGWNTPQLEFVRSTLTYPSSASLKGTAQYDRYYDVLVIGDSFSRSRPRIQWQNYLALATGWSIGTLDLDHARLQQVLDGRMFQEHPPRILIYESVERVLPHRLRDDPVTCGGDLAQMTPDVHSAAAVTESLDWETMLSGEAEFHNRSRQWSAINLGYIERYLWYNLKRLLMFDAPVDTVSLPLSTAAPFSSRNKHAMLVYKDDFEKIPLWREIGPAQFDCWTRETRRRVESNGRTRFLLLVAPDKLTAYSGFLGDAGLKEASVLSDFCARHPGVAARLDLSLKAAILREEEDVYLPNDTHWGSNGNRIVAETLIDLLRKAR